VTESTRRNPLCVALDTTDDAEFRRLAESLAGEVGMLKVGLTAFAALGPRALAAMPAGPQIFLDLKLHDIPAQVEGAARAVAELGVDFVTVHAAGGSEMVSAAVKGADGRVSVLGVTVLTSLDESDLAALGVSGPLSDVVLRLGRVALESGAGGLVCSPHEVALVRADVGLDPVLVVPGIRPSGAGTDDQRRTLPPRAAVVAGADVIVVGRPITGAPDPVAAARSIVAEIQG
jgi:orotidine-5'-phosphate decarboxylase